MVNTCTRVSLRQRAIKNDRISLYLDFYPPVRNPETMQMSRREYLGIYIYAHPKNEMEREFNTDMLNKAEAIRCIRTQSLINEEFGFLDKTRQKGKRLRVYTFPFIVKVLTFAPYNFKSNAIMRATERYERAWNAFQIHLNHNPKASLIPFLKERHVNHRSMHRWMSEKGYSVRLAKQQIRLLQAEARKECSEATAKDTGMMFLPMEMPSDSVCPENYLFGITLTFPNGTIVTIKKGSAKSVMHLMKLYEKEDLLCLD